MRAVIFFNTILGLLILTIILFQILLRRSMKRSLYNYRNVTFIAGIIFGCVLAVSLYNYLIECLINTKDMRIYYIFKEFITFPRKFSMFAIPVFLVISVLLIISNIALIKNEGMRIKNILGLFLGLFFIGGTFLNYKIEDYIETTILYEDGPFDTPLNWVIHTYVQLFIVILICYVEVYFIATMIMAYVASKQEPRYNKDYIIILGCSIRKNGELPPLLKGRVDRAIKYAWDQERECGLPVKFVASGGKGVDEITSEGTAIGKYLSEHGAEPYEVLVEKKSRNTMENFKYSKELIDKANPKARICFATTNYHVYRSGLSAKRLGIDVEAVASKTKWYFWPNGLIRECVAMLWMEKKFHAISVFLIALLCIGLAMISYHVFQIYWL